jgi:hypothetical protein
VRRAVEHFRQLAAVQPEISLFYLVAGLHSLGLILQDLGRHKEVFDTAEEALRLLSSSSLPDPARHAELLAELRDLYRDAAKDAGLEPVPELPRVS